MWCVCLTLRYDGDGSAEVGESEGADVDAVDEDSAVTGFESSEQSCSQRCLSCSCSSYDAGFLAGLDVEVDIFQNEWQLISVSS